MHAKSLQSCPTLHDPMDVTSPVSSDHGIFQARIQEWALLFSSGVFPTQGLNLSLWILLHRQGTRVSEFLTTSTTWEALTLMYSISLIFCQIVLSVIDNESLRNPTATVELSISSFSSVGFPSCVLGLYAHVLEGLHTFKLYVLPSHTSVCLQWIDPFIIIKWHEC